VKGTTAAGHGTEWHISPAGHPSGLKVGQRTFGASHGTGAMGNSGHATGTGTTGGGTGSPIVGTGQGPGRHMSGAGHP